MVVGCRQKRHDRSVQFYLHTGNKLYKSLLHFSSLLWWSGYIGHWCEYLRESSCRNRPTVLIVLKMLISTGMLILLAVLFAIPAFFGWRSRRQDVKQRPRSSTDRPKGRRLHDALIGTLDDLISAVIIFTLSVNIAALII